MVNSVLKEKELDCNNLEELDKVAQEIVDFAKDKKIWLFEGEMGAGKTTLIKAICNYLKVVDVVNSPTFSIVNEYKSSNEETFYHFDFYRLKGEDEALDIGVEEYFDSGSVCFIEWPSKISEVLPEDKLVIKIEVLGKEQRHFELIHNE